MYSPKLFQKLSKYRNSVLRGILGLCILYILLSSSFHYKMGNLFFGEVPALYNLTLAHFFFAQAATPLIGRAPSMANYQLSRTYFIAGNFDPAITYANKELELYPENKRTYYILGLTYGYMHQEEKAIDAFSQFILWKPDSWAARNDKAWLQFRRGDIKGALATIEPVTWNIENPWVQNTYGALLMNTGDYINAKEVFMYAKIKVDTMTEESWGAAYPGNDPRVYNTGLHAMSKSIDTNLALIEKKLSSVHK